MIRAVCFDLDGRLLHEGFSEAVQRTSNALAAQRPEINAELLAAINRAAFDAYRHEAAEAFVLGTMSGDEISRLVWRQTLTGAGIDDEALVESALETFIRETTATYRLFDDVMPVLEALGERIPLAVITNGASDVQRRKLIATGIESRFRALMVSGEHDTPKPDARIFQGAARMLRVEPRDALHVGDSLEADVAGAIGAGMTGVWLNRDGRARDASQADPHHEITSLDELQSLLEL